jgi:hypothetical protein
MPANLLYVENVATYFRELVDEPDQGFMSEAVAQTWLQVGFDQYHNFMTTADPERFIASSPQTFVNAFEFDLDNVLLGLAAPNRMSQLVRVVRLDPVSSRPNYYLYPVASREQLDSLNSGFGMVLLSAKKLHFSEAQDGSYRIDYIPVSTVDWALTAPGNNEWIDDNIQWHDMIGLYAALQYSASAGFTNEQVVMLLQVRQAAFKSFLQRGRSINAARYVQDDDPYSGW